MIHIDDIISVQRPIHIFIVEVSGERRSDIKPYFTFYVTY